MRLRLTVEIYPEMFLPDSVRTMKVSLYDGNDCIKVYSRRQVFMEELFHKSYMDHIFEDVKRSLYAELALAKEQQK